jgi:hypothetical protein
MAVTAPRLSIVAGVSALLASACAPARAPFPPRPIELATEPLPGDACAALRSIIDAPWDGRHESLAQICSRVFLSPRERRFTEGQDWTLEDATRLLPTVRLYLMVDRYPSTRLIDFASTDALPPAPEPELDELLRRHCVRIESEEDALELVRFFVRASAAPYLPTELNLDSEKLGAAWEVTARYRRAVPWSPPDRPDFAGSKTTEEEDRFRVDAAARDGPHGCASVRLLNQHTRDVSTSPD